MKTQKTRRSRSDALEQEKSSGKKMVQARLPFKLITTPTGESVGEKSAETVKTTEPRKRKLSYKDKEETEKSITEQSSKRRSVRNEDSNKEPAKEKQKGTNVVVLSDDSNDNDDSGRFKGNVKTIAKQKACDSKEESLDVHSDDVELIGSTDEEETKIPEKSKMFLTPVSNTKNKGKLNKTPVSDKKSTKKTTTPKSGTKSTGKGRKKSEESPSTSKSKKLQIRLPVNGKKTKRRKQAAKLDLASEEHDMSDDVEIISKELHPEKRPKLESPKDKSETNENEKKTKETNPVGKEIEDDDSKEVVSPKSKENEEIGEQDDVDKSLKQRSNTESDDKQHESEDLASESEQSKSKVLEISGSSSELESDTEANTTVNSERSQNPKTPNSLKDGLANKTLSPNVNLDSSATKLQKKNLTPKQQKLVEQRLKAREEKERKIQEEREQKQREKEERELAKKREREEKEEQRRKEREEKEEQRRKEREEKERKRLAETEAKNEEKRKRNEAKEEEQRKKEEERKRKEQEKEEAEMKKKKAAMAFTKFFSRPAQESIVNRSVNKNVVADNNELLAFRPFQIKGDMKLAPIVRKKLNDEERANLVSVMETKDQENDDQTISNDLYLGELLNGSVKPYKWSPPPEIVETKQKNYDDDVILVEDELERAGQAIVEEHNEQLERFRAKFFKFHENRRPPYFGTWRKKSSVITPRRPFVHDKKFFDYEIDSDDEWEEEEPGESLDGSDDDKEKESEDDDYEVDNEWFVPHGHLSEEEMQNEDELGENNDREAQKAKLKIMQQEFAQEMKKKTEKIKPRLIGCIWVDENGNEPELCPKIIWDTLCKRAILCGEPPIMVETNSTTDKNGEINAVNGQNNDKSNNGEIKLKPITLTDEMLKQLVKLVHGNTHSKNFLIKEFIAYIEANEESVRNGNVRGPLKSAVREKIEEYAQWQAVELIKFNNNKTNKGENKNAKAQKIKKKLCWVVAKDLRQSMNLNEMELNNNWEYILQPRHRSRVIQKEDITPVVEAITEDSNANSEASVDQYSVASGNVTESLTPGNIKSKKKPDITKFTKVLTAEEKSQQMQKKTEEIKSKSVKEKANSSPAGNDKSENKKTNSQKSTNTNQTPTMKKRVPLLISVARGQSISTPDKNARISQFLKTINDAKQKEKNEDINPPSSMQTDDIVILD